jgi:hypothetical protein
VREVLSKSSCRPRSNPLIKIRLYPGISGFIILLPGLVDSLVFGRNGLGLWALTLLSMPVLIVLLEGAVIKGVLSLLPREVEVVDVRPGLLRWGDMSLSLIGLTYVFWVLTSITTTDVPELKIGPISTIVGLMLFFICNGMGYLSWTDIGNRVSFRKIAFGLAWFLFWCAQPFLAFEQPTVLRSYQHTIGRDAILNDLNNIAAQAYQYRIKPKSMQGGNGSYVGFQIPSQMTSNANGKYLFKVVSVDTIAFKAVAPEGNASIIVRIDGDGKLIQSSWQYKGGFEPTWLEELLAN